MTIYHHQVDIRNIFQKMTAKQMQLNQPVGLVMVGMDAFRDEIHRDRCAAMIYRERMTLKLDSHKLAGC